MDTWKTAPLRGFFVLCAVITVIFPVKNLEFIVCLQGIIHNLA